METHISGICEDCDNLRCALISLESRWKDVPEIVMCRDHISYTKIIPPDNADKNKIQEPSK